jgi:hypothetical protein
MKKIEINFGSLSYDRYGVEHRILDINGVRLATSNNHVRIYEFLLIVLGSKASAKRWYNFVSRSNSYCYPFEDSGLLSGGMDTTISIMEKLSSQETNFNKNELKIFKEMKERKFADILNSAIIEVHNGQKIDQELKLIKSYYENLAADKNAIETFTKKRKRLSDALVNVIAALNKNLLKPRQKKNKTFCQKKIKNKMVFIR